MSTHCWVTQQCMRPASKRQLGKQISAHAQWRHSKSGEMSHVLMWLLLDMPRWRHTAPGVGGYHVTSTFPQVTSHTLPLRPLPRNVSVNNLPRNNMGRCVFCGTCRGVILKTNGATQAGTNPCGGGVEYLHRDPASRRRRRKWSLKSETVKYGRKSQGTTTEKDCAGKGQRHIQKTDPSSRQRGCPTEWRT
jgi:hypothetical protein